MRFDVVESERIEFKEAVNDSAIKTIAAFANGGGGRFTSASRMTGKSLGFRMSMASSSNSPIK